MHSRNSSDGSNPAKQKNMKKKNMRRLGGGGLSLEAFANAKSRNNNYNPSLIKKQKEFYRNAKFVNKYKKSLKQEGGGKVDFPSFIEPQEDDVVVSGDAINAEKNRIKKPYSLKELYEKKVEEDQKVRTEREANFQAKKEAREKTESRRKEVRAKMFKKTRSGQPVMKYRIEHMLETIQGSDKK